MKIIYLLISIIIVLSLICIKLILDKNNLKNEFEAEKDMFLYNKNKISMIEYHYRNFKEGQNAFTTLRNISNVLKDIYIQ